MRGFGAALAVVAVSALAGCAGSHMQQRRPDPPAETGLSDYWLKQPAVASASGADFDRLWSACRRSVQTRSFVVDRVDLRGGTMTTFPQISKQIFEPWRNDVGTFAGVLQSTLGTVRRSVHFDVRKLDDGTWKAEPKVIVERYAQTERRITSVARYTEILAVDPLASGNRQRDRLGADQPIAYWYALGRDEALEKQICEDVRRDLRS